MKSNMTISVEFMAGTDIKDAVIEAKAKAAKLNLAYIRFNFNGVQFSIGRNADIDDVMYQWENGARKYGICAA